WRLWIHYLSSLPFRQIWRIWLLSAMT
ncbi:transcriptional regulator, LysR family, partial [Vibrio parahaemolyticus VPTS-2010]